MNKTKVTGGFLAVLAGIWSLIWKSGGKEFATEMVMNNVSGLRKKVGETTNEAKGSVIDERLFNIVLNEGFREKNVNELRKIKSFWYELQGRDQVNNTDEAPAFILYVANMLVASAELWERQHKPVKISKEKETSSKAPKTRSPDDNTDIYVSYRTGINEAILWLKDLLEIDSFGLRLEYLEQEQVFTLISEEEKSTLEKVIGRENINKIKTGAKKTGTVLKKEKTDAGTVLERFSNWCDSKFQPENKE